MNSLQILSFVGFTLLVAVITWWKVRKTDTGSQQGYFLAGRSLKAPVIAASLMLTNLPARWRSTACFMWVSRYNFPMVRLSGYW